MKKNILLVFILCFLIFINLSFASNQKIKVDNNIVKQENIENNSTNKNIENINTPQNDIAIERTGTNKNIKSITALDVIGDEKVSPELRKRVTDTLNKAQYEFDKYNSYIDNHTKNADNQFIKIEREINDLKSFTEELEANFSLAKWMVISLSVGIVCLATIITVMWKGVVNVNRNDVEVLYSIERIKKELRFLDKRLEMLETAYKNERK